MTGHRQVELDPAWLFDTALGGWPMTDAADWLNEADKALYAAKNSGRDKVHFTLGDIVNAP